MGPGLDLSVGLPVIALVYGRAKPSKGQAEYVVADLFAFTGAPGLDPVLAATLPLNALTAAQASSFSRSSPKKSLLVKAAVPRCWTSAEQPR